MSTLRQKKLAKNIIENSKRKKPLNKAQLVVSSGYTESSAESSAHLILAQKGVKDELEVLGFTEDAAKKVVAEIMLNSSEKASDRLKATEQVFKVHGSFKKDEEGNSPNFNFNIRDLRSEFEN